MFRRIVLFLCASFFCVFSYAQDDAREVFEKFRQQALGTYSDFRKEVNKKYSEFIRNAWKEYKKAPAVSKPKEDERPPVIMSEDDRDKTVEDHPITIKEVVNPPAPRPQPVPITPIQEQPQLDSRFITFTFYGTECRVRFAENSKILLPNCDNKTIATAWETLSTDAYNNTIADCLQLREEYNLCDWAYINMLKTMSEACLGQSNAAVLLMAYVYCQSGYDMRLGVADGRLCLLYASQHVIYGQDFYFVKGKTYYPFGTGAGTMYICEAAFPKEKPLDLAIPHAIALAYQQTPKRTIQSQRYPEIRMTVSTNKNLIDFYNTYPSSMIGEDFMTRWLLYANAPLEEEVSTVLSNGLKAALSGLSEKESVERLLNLVQTGFVYEYDDKVWGGDRVFFAEETLFYPYCDCEDRSILFSRLVRDVLGLKVVLVYYPGHLAAAVRFEETVHGDYINLGTDRYTICDPTYIGASIGRTMPGMDNATANVILLD